MDKTLTHHFVDDQAIPDIDGVEPWDLAMDMFRKNCQFPPHRFLVSKGGRTMTFHMRGMKLAGDYERMAGVLILTHQLPLTVKRDTFEIEAIEIDNVRRSKPLLLADDLVITYDPQAH